jgi:methanogenic corrinoid protein MtbC1
MMKMAELFKQYLEHVFRGKRHEARQLVIDAQDRGVSASKLLKMIVWPAMEQIDRLYREDQIPVIIEHMATRINRMLADELHGMLARAPKHGKRMVVVCGEGETGELGAQIVADLLEADGWNVWFLGAGVPNDEILQFVARIKCDLLCIYGTVPAGVARTRHLVDMIRHVGACDQMQILVGGGVFNRAGGLADEIRADMFAGSVTDILRVVEEHPVRIPRPDMPEPGRRRKRKSHKPEPAIITKMRKATITVEI